MIMADRKITFQSINDELRGTICSFLDTSALWSFYTGCCRNNRDKEQLGQCLSTLHSGIVGASSTMESLRYPIHLLDPSSSNDGFARWILGRSVPLQSIVLFFPEGIHEAVCERIIDRIILNLASGRYVDLRTFVIKFGAVDVESDSKLAGTIRRIKGIWDVIVVLCSMSISLLMLHTYVFYSTCPFLILS